MNRVLLTPRAEQDLEEIGDYIATDNPIRAHTFVQEIRTHFSRIAESPTAYPRRQELGDNVRTCLHGRYVVFFRFDANQHVIVILRVLHSARELTSLFPESS